MAIRGIALVTPCTKRIHFPNPFSRNALQNLRVDRNAQTTIANTARISRSEIPSPEATGAAGGAGIP
jgi:hypothetical protein